MNFWSGKFIGSALFLLLFFLIFLIFVDRGRLVVTAPAPFILDAKDFRLFECKISECFQKIPSGEREFCIIHEKYFPVCQTLFIPLFGKTTWNPLLYKIPTLREEEKNEKNTPLPESSTSQDFGDWKTVSTEFGRFFAFQPETGDLLLFETDEKSSVVSHFSTEIVPEIFSAGEKILVKMEKEIFLVDPDLRQKFRIFSGKSPEIKILKNGFLVSDEGTIFFFSAPDFAPRALPFFADLSHIAFCEDSFFVFREGNFIRFFGGNLVQKNIATAKSFGDFSLECGSEEKTLRLVFVDGSHQILEF